MGASLRSRLWLGLAGLSGAASVAVGAYVHHGLDPVGDAHAIQLLEIGSGYQSLHAAALIAVALLAERLTGRLARLAVLIGGWAFVAGLLLFSATLEALALGASTALTPVVPTGGTAFIVGWLALAAAGLAGGR